MQSQLEIINRNLSVFKAAKDAFLNGFPTNADAVAYLDLVKQYEGWGRCRKLIDPTSEEYLSAYNQLISLSSVSDESASAEYAKRMLSEMQSATLTSFYTPESVARTITHYTLYAFRQLNGKSALTLLEPSAGSGNFLSNITDISNLQQVETCEKDTMSRCILNARMDAMSKLTPFGHSCQLDAYEKAEHCAYDIIVSNIPFGDVRVSDPQHAKHGDIYKQSQKYIHNYYFLKSMRLLNDGGILAFITSRGFLSSPSNRPYREEMLKHGRILNIVRLPDNMFPTIEVGTDLIVYQKTTQPGNETLTNIFAQDWKEEEKDNFFPLHTEVTPKKNQFGKSVLYYKYQGTDLPTDLLNILQGELHYSLPPTATAPTPSFPVEFKDFPSPSPSPSVPISEIESRPNPNPQPKMKTPPLAKRTAPIAKRTAPVSEASASAQSLGIFALLSNPSPTIEQTSAYLTCITTVMQNMYSQLNNCNRPIFKQMYDSMLAVFNYNLKQSFTSIHDILSSRLVIATDKQTTFLNSLEKRDNGTWLPADIFFKALGRYEGKLTPEQALASSLNEFGKVNIPYMEQRTDMDVVDIADQLQEQMYFNPITGIYEEADLWLSGNVVKKATEAEQALDKWKNGERLQAEHAIAALKAARPQAIPFNDIDVGFGARWVPIEYFIAFIKEIGEMDEYDFHNLYYVPQTDQYVGEFNVSYRSPHWRDWRVKNRRAEDFIIDAMHDTIHKFTTEDDEGNKIPDKDSMMQASKIVTEIRTLWIEWINKPKQAEARKVIEKIYNERFNCEVRPRYDGSFQTFPNLHLENLGIRDLYPSQKDCIWMNKRNYGGVCYHDVGAGKTLIMCISAYEMKRTGICNKPLIIGMKANVSQIAETFKAAYPDAKLLYPTKKDFQEKNRKDFFNQIKNNDWDCIIMSHDQFGYLPVAEETEIQLMQEEIDGLNDVLLDIDARSRRWMGRILSGLQKRKQNLEIKLRIRQEEIRNRTDKVMDFGELGIDFIEVDESHVFKNLEFSTRNERVAGIGNPQGSKRAWKLLTAIRDIQRRRGTDLCATFYSGTIVSNSLTELYLIFKYLRPKALAEQNIHSFDAWAANFCERHTDYEMNIVNQVQMKESYSAYVNLPELSQFFRQITDYRTAEMCGIDLPKVEQHFDSAPPTPQQQEMLRRLTTFVSSGRWSDLDIQREAPSNLDKAHMLVATNIARQTSLDTRLIDDCKSFGDEDNNKVRRCADYIFDLYEETDADKGTQFVFTDIGTLDANKWNLQQAVRDILVNEKGIPSEEVAFINEATTDAKRLALFEKMNNGEVRILIGSTTKLGTGVNAQKRAVAVHHLDIPWRPSDLEQRNGRMVRSGNELAKKRGKVDIYIYATENTLDAYKFGKLKNKQTFIDQLNHGTIGVRRIDGSILDDGDKAVSYAEFCSIVSGNQDLLTKSKLDAKIMALEKDRKAFYTKRNQAVASIAQYKTDNKSDEEWIKKAKLDVASADIDEHTIATLTKGSKFADLKECGKALIATSDTCNNEDYKIIGKCGGMEIATIRKPADAWNPNGHTIFYMVGKSGQYYLAACGTNYTGHINRNSYEAAAHLPFDTLNYINTLITKKSEAVVKRIEQLPALEDIKSREWDGNDVLNQLKHELDEVNERINKTITSPSN